MVLRGWDIGPMSPMRPFLFLVGVPNPMGISTKGRPLYIHYIHLAMAHLMKIISRQNILHVKGTDILDWASLHYNAQEGFIFWVKQGIKDKYSN